MKNELTDADIAKAFGVESTSEKIDKSRKDNFFKPFKEMFGKLGNTAKKDVLSAFLPLRLLATKKVNILIVGASGAGKSETINALLKDAKITDQQAIAKKGSDSVTTDITSFTIGTCTVHDSPGLGDLSNKDVIHIQKIQDKILELDKDGNRLIDLIIVVLNGVNLRDRMTWQKLINEILIPNMEDPNNLIVAINKVDQYDDGDNWDKKNNKPTQELRQDIENEIKTVQKHIKLATKLDIKPIYYSAGRKERRKKPWNLIALYNEMNQKAPDKKKFSLATNINTNKDNFSNGDNVDKVIKDIKDDISKDMEKGILEEITKSNPKQESNQPNNKTKKNEKKRKKEKTQSTPVKGTDPEKDEPSGWLGKLIGIGASILGGIFGGW